MKAAPMEPIRYSAGWWDGAASYGRQPIFVPSGEIVCMLQALRIVTAEQVEQLRQIRNLDRDGYGTPTPEITPEQQAAWWAANRDQVRAWLYADVDCQIVGFGLVRPNRDNGGWCPSAGVLPEHRGRGYGRWIVSDLMRRSPVRLHAAAKRSNVAACKTHHPRDWVEVDGPDPDYRYFLARHDPADQDAVLADGWGRYGFQWGHR